MISTDLANQLLDFGANLSVQDGPRAKEQLDGAVALHNILERGGVAYLADEVGMGKTYVALGAVALFRHFHPDFRVLVIAPKANIQSKWMKEMGNFVAHNIRFPELRMKSLDGKPARRMAHCERLVDLVEEVALDPHRDFFLRMTSFSLAVPSREQEAAAAAKKLGESLRSTLPWLKPEVFAHRDKLLYKDNVARAINCALPAFDLVIIDEAHNLKHGFSDGVSARNRVLAIALGRDHDIDRDLFPTYGVRAKRTLFLSATPVEDSYRQLWNQLDVLGHTRGYDELRADDLRESQLKDVASRFLVRRVTSLSVGGAKLTKNLYRRDWREGGVAEHDEPLKVADPRQRLVVALVQKKVTEILGNARFDNSFQMGMLASFESFFQTAGSRRRQDEEASNFDQSDQTEDALEREGVDVQALDRIISSHRRTGLGELPHPKMDALVCELAKSWHTGEKALVFVRRVASVKELKRKLDDAYDVHLMDRLRHELPALREELDALFRAYGKERSEARESDRDLAAVAETEGDATRASSKRDELADTGGIDTFFSWFFRGQGPTGRLSGALVQKRLVDAGFFDDNYLAALLDCAPSEALERLAAAIGASTETATAEVTERAAKYATRSPDRSKRFLALQAGAFELLKDVPNSHQQDATLVWEKRFAATRAKRPSTDRIPIDLLGASTFFSELRRRGRSGPDGSSLRSRIWPASTRPTYAERFAEEELRASFLGSAARLGHSLIDLFILYARREGTLKGGARALAVDETFEERERGRVDEYIALLEEQMSTDRRIRGWRGFDELSDLSANLDLVIRTNIPSARDALAGSDLTRELATLFRRQQPVGGMSGQLSTTLVSQFRMPGYPLVMITTDLLQEGEDLHTFCSKIYHYGISWTPSSMEQRIGRIDRVSSATDRRLSALATPPSGEDLLQVYMPHLGDTVEVLQVRRLLRRVNRFLTLMHEGLRAPEDETSTINTSTELACDQGPVPRITEVLETAFPVRPAQLVGTIAALAVSPEASQTLENRFAQLTERTLPGLDVAWTPARSPGQLIGEVRRIGTDARSFTLLLRSLGQRALVRCVSAIGKLEGKDEIAIEEVTWAWPARLVTALARDESSDDLTVEEDVFLASSPETDAVRIAHLVDRVTSAADLVARECFAQTPSRADAPQTIRSWYPNIEPAASSWRTKLRGQPDIRVSADKVTVTFGEGRHHDIELREDATSLVLRGKVTHERFPNDGLRLWKRHRALPFATFRTLRNSEDLLVGEVWVPKIGLDADELVTHVRLLAAECDRLEQLLTGEDRY